MKKRLFLIALALPLFLTSCDLNRNDFLNPDGSIKDDAGDKIDEELQKYGISAEEALEIAKDINSKLPQLEENKNQSYTFRGKAFDEQDFKAGDALIEMNNEDYKFHLGAQENYRHNKYEKYIWIEETDVYVYEYSLLEKNEDHVCNKYSYVHKEDAIREFKNFCRPSNDDEIINQALAPFGGDVDPYEISQTVLQLILNPEYLPTKLDKFQTQFSSTDKQGGDLKASTKGEIKDAKGNIEFEFKDYMIVSGKGKGICGEDEGSVSFTFDYKTPVIDTTGLKDYLK